ncbi:hypothetical protein EFA69_02680 [Rufibacter immobilis]|uniref:Uncharacterized protein n=1 Tax=Rufibacter immobilis TaxID=1348778 RepID=A0A3M9N372_9BACT|nr:hypothetical protein [Rufibacter immobilis]RNI32251.1 hypothetical protein EFA69_02680 [Rufibacter immobilis]
MQFKNSASFLRQGVLCPFNTILKLQTFLTMESSKNQEQVNPELFNLDESNDQIFSFDEDEMPIEQLEQLEKESDERLFGKYGDIQEELGDDDWNWPIQSKNSEPAENKEGQDDLKHFNPKTLFGH